MESNEIDIGIVMVTATVTLSDPTTHEEILNARVR
jgi:hypothetical protein